MNHFYLQCLVYAALCVTFCIGKSVLTIQDEYEEEELVKYLAKFNGLTRNDREIDLLSEGSGEEILDSSLSKLKYMPNFIESLISFQQMAGLEPTGIIDEETILKTEAPRCGVPDPIADPNAPSNFRVKSIWDTKYNVNTGLYYLTYSILDRRTPKSLNFRDYETGLASAMCTWEQISNVRFKYIGVGKMFADIKTKFDRRDHGDGYSFDGPGGTLAHAFYPEDGRLHFDIQENWYLAKEKAVNHRKKDIYNTALHELGHIIGLLHSDNSSAIMAPFYRFYGTFDNLKIHQDDIDGVLDMYGERINSDPYKEQSSACSRLKKNKGKIEITKAPKNNMKKHAVFTSTIPTVTCEDNTKYLRFCPQWKAAGHCRDHRFGKVMHRRCMKTCGYCADNLPKKKQMAEKISSLSESICHIEKFDSVATIYDESDGFSLYIFKDNYYFESSLAMSEPNETDISLLNDSTVLDGTLAWYVDPKTIVPGLFRIRSDEFLDRPTKIDAFLVVGNRYLAFDGELVHIYNKLTPKISFEKSFLLPLLFPGYPHSSVDAAYVEYENGHFVYTLFRHDRLWQYKQVKDYFQQDESTFLLIPVDGMINAGILNWKGVAASNIDAVFSYKGIPYFMKGNIFWPATDQEPQVARDITYNVFRCWEEEPVHLSIPSNLSYEGHNSAVSIKNYNQIVIFMTLLISFLTSESL